MMWLPLILCLLAALPPIACFQTHLGQPSRQYSPSSLDDCMDLATNQLARWKQVYGVCIAMFLSKTRPPSHPPFGSQSNALKGVVMSTDAQYSGHSDINIGVTPVYEHERSDGGMMKRAEETIGNGEAFQAEFSNDNKGEDRPQMGNSRDDGQAWLSVMRRAVRLRTRRQHSLSINSALVSLADMLVAQDYGRERARQNAFRKQLMGLGR
ncbi:uncharacterized protein [Littorina saxatilis]|uniref:uncharacterized protein n=1 Tax=Littorina saxatilis TaxID=31220 RepID=UPI0038B4C345